MRNAIILVLLALFIVGCIQSAGGNSYVSDYAASLNRTPISDPSQIAHCEFGGCHCMVCRNGTNIFGSSITSLIGASCYIETECNQTNAARLYDSNQTPDLYIRSFMLGQGPTFSDFAYANPYCSYRLSMAVQFLTATNETPYELPDAERAMCMLSKDIIPVYVLYSKGNNLNVTRAREIGRVLGTEGDDVFLGRLSDGPVGPNIVVAEIDFNSSDTSLVASQIQAINEGCLNDRTSPNGTINCWVAVAPKFGDFASLNSVMAQVGDQVDVIAFGVNNKSVDACDRGRVNPAKMMNAVRNFTEYAMYNLSKPSLIPYVLFDPGVQDPGGCNWTESDVVAAYSAFWPTGVTSLQQKGLIGIAPYNFNSTQYGDVANPLGCRNCAVGSSQSRLRAWYGWCQSYTNITRRGANAHPSGGTPIIYPNASGGYCDFNANADYLFREVTFGDAGANRDILSPRSPDVRAAGEVLFRCSACATNNLSANAGSPFPSVGSGSAMSDTLCHKYYPQIEYWADAKSVDPMLVRAFIYSESGFDECAAAKVCRAGYDGPGCFNPGPGQDECYSNAYDEIYDPSGACNANLTNAPNSNSDNPDWRWCAFGLAQSIAPPYTYWEADHSPDGQDGQYADIYRESGFYPHSDSRLDVAASCAQETDPPGEYNPFNPSHSICVAATDVASAMRSAEAIVRDLHSNGALPWGTTGSGTEKDDVFAMYIAAHLYRGTWGMSSSSLNSVGGIPPPCAGGLPLGQCFTSQFQLASSVDAEYCTPDSDDNLPPECESEGVPRYDPPEFCYGVTDPIQFFQECIFPFMSGFPADPGARKIELYFQFKQCPNNSCPDGLALYQAMCTPDETGQLNPDLCIGPGQPRLPSSGTPYIPDNSSTNGSST
jgi:hypothetical protein